MRAGGPPPVGDEVEGEPATLLRPRARRGAAPKPPRPAPSPDSAMRSMAQWGEQEAPEEEARDAAGPANPARGATQRAACDWARRRSNAPAIAAMRRSELLTSGRQLRRPRRREQSCRVNARNTLKVSFQRPAGLRLFLGLQDLRALQGREMRLRCRSCAVVTTTIHVYYTKKLPGHATPLFQVST